MPLRHNEYYMQDGDVTFLVSREAFFLPGNVHILTYQRLMTRSSKFINVSLLGVKRATLG